MWFERIDNRLLQMPARHREVEQVLKITSAIGEHRTRKSLGMLDLALGLACLTILRIKVIVQVMLERPVDRRKVEPLRRPEYEILNSLDRWSRQAIWSIRRLRWKLYRGLLCSRRLAFH